MEVARSRVYRGYFCERQGLAGWAVTSAAHGDEVNEAGALLVWPGWGRLKHAIDASYRAPGIEDSDDEGDDDE